MLHGCTISETCDFHLLTLDLNFVKKSLINKRFFFWETFDLWNLEVLKFLFQILRLWKLEIFYLKSEILSLRILKIKAWNFDHEIWSLIFFFFFGLTESTQFDWVDSAFAKLKSVGLKFWPPHFIVSLFFLFSFIFHQLLFLHWHYSPSSSPWFFFFISPFLLTKSTFLNFSTLPHPSLSIFL